VEFVRQAANVEELPIVGADRDRAVEVVVGEGQVGRFRVGDLVAIDVRTQDLPRVLDRVGREVETGNVIGIEAGGNVRFRSDVEHPIALAELVPGRKAFGVAQVLDVRSDGGCFTHRFRILSRVTSLR